MPSDLARDITSMKQLKAERAEILRRGLDPGEEVVSEGWGFLVTAERIRTRDRPDVLLDRVRSWHIRWSHDERPTVVVAHEPIIVEVRTRPLTILWFHLGNKPREEGRTITALRFAGRRRPAFHATTSLFERLGIPQIDDEHDRPLGTRDQRVAQVTPYLLIRTTWLERRQAREGHYRPTLPSLIRSRARRAARASYGRIVRSGDAEVP